VEVRTMLRAYINRWKEREKPEESCIDYWFASDAEKACGWDTREEAERNCAIFNGHRISVRLARGGTHVCSDFKVEQRALNEFVVFCEVPSLPEPPSNQGDC
jgi:hypothetical protein